MTVPPGLPDRIAIREVGPRDGLQPEAPVAVADRLRLIAALIDAGASEIEVTAFVSPKAVPAMAGAAEVVAGTAARPGLVRTALVPNVRGAELALAAGVDALTVTISASAVYNERNVRMSIDESVAEIARIAEAARAANPGLVVDAVVSCAFGSPYEGEIAPAAVGELARRLDDAGATRLTYADTTGMATPRRVHEVLDAVADAGLRGPGPGLHLHDTRGTALVNAFAALQRGVARFDTAVGGVGGSPFAHGAGGNLATESLVALTDDLGIESGYDVEALVQTAALVEELIGRAVPSAVAHHGPRHRRAATS